MLLLTLNRNSETVKICSIQSGRGQTLLWAVKASQAGDTLSVNRSPSHSDKIRIRRGVF